MFRNKEIRHVTFLFLLITCISTVLGFLISPDSGILLLLTAAAFGTTFLLFTRKRYQSLARLADQIDLVLHNEDHLYLDELDEGELSILQTEITKMTSRIREQNSALQREKVQLADSLADIAHQLRTPLTSANLILSLLKNNPDDSQRRSLLRENEELFAHMDWLVNSLLKLSRLDAGIVSFQPEKINLSDFIHTAIHPLLIAMDLHDITMHIQIPDQAFFICDKSWMSEVIQNILKNCIENTNDHGMIEITCSDTPLFTELSLHDNGPGFDQADLPHLFERFYRGKNDGATGYGIGLSLCKSIITRQGGTILAKNHPHGGALFLIRFQK